MLVTAAGKEMVENAGTVGASKDNEYLGTNFI